MLLNGLRQTVGTGMSVRVAILRNKPEFYFYCQTKLSAIKTKFSFKRLLWWA